MKTKDIQTKDLNKKLWEGCMSDIYDLMAEEARQSFFQFENVTFALDSKAFGVVTADALLFSVFSFISPFSNWLFYIPVALLIISCFLLIGCVYPRHFHRQFSEDTINNYGTMDSKMALSHIAANYAHLERSQYKIYKNKLNWFLTGLILMVAAMVCEMIIFAYVTFCP